MKDERSLNIDIARIFAILGVTYYHIWKRMHRPENIVGIFNLDGFARWGVIGVVIMFVISGYCMVGSYNRLQGLSTGKRLKSFYISRFLRIAPAYYISILICCIFMANNLKPQPYELKDVIAHLLFIHALSMETVATIKGFYWYISVQMIFYMLVPLIFFICKKAVQWLHLSDTAKKCYSVLAVIFLLPLIWLPMFGEMEYIAMLPCFLVGMLAAYLKDVKVPKSIGILCFLVGVGMIFLKSTYFIPYDIYKCTAGIAIAVGFLWMPKINVKNSLRTIIITLSTASYSIYLYQFVFFAFIGKKRGGFVMTLFVIFTVAVGLLMYLCVEYPLSNLLFKSKKKPASE